MAEVDRKTRSAMVGDPIDAFQAPESLKFELPVDPFPLLAEDNLSEDIIEGQSITPILEIPSPLSELNTPGFPVLNSLTYKAQMSLYPAKVITINNYRIKPLLHGYNYTLAPGSYIIEVSPDFSLISDIKTFMNFPYEIKRVEIKLERNKQYRIGARINPDAPQNWSVQLYEIQALTPLD